MNKSGRTAERLIKPRLNKVFNEEGLKITIEPATQVTDYLDVKLNLSTHSHEPFRKPNDYPLYVNTNSNHPPHTFTHIPKTLAKRLSTLSSDKATFEMHRPWYEKALKEQGYTCNLKYEEPSSLKKRKRAISRLMIEMLATKSPDRKSTRRKLNFTSRTPTAHLETKPTTVKR